MEELVSKVNISLIYRRKRIIMKFKKIAAFSLLALMAGMSLASCQSSEDITYNSGFIKEKTTIFLPLL